MSPQDAPDPLPSSDDVHAYCREVEAYLCRRNDGHLIRVVGPAFDLVKGWAAQGIPLSLVREAIDRVVERAEKKTTRRRPIRIEFCEGEVLATYDRWRRAVGVAQPDQAPASSGPRRGSLHAHVERVTVQLTAVLGGGRAPAALQPAVKAALTALDGVQAALVTRQTSAPSTGLVDSPRSWRTPSTTWLRPWM